METIVTVLVHGPVQITTITTTKPIWMLFIDFGGCGLGTMEREREGGRGEELQDVLVYLKKKRGLFTIISQGMEDGRDHEYMRRG